MLINQGSPDNTIGGTASGDSNLLSGNTFDGIQVTGSGTTGTIIVGNRIGTDITGTLALANVAGVYIQNAAGTMIGGTASGDSNLISGNTADGVYLYGSGTTGTIIVGNEIGTDITGVLALGNENGVRVENAPDNTIGGSVSGDTNVISGNSTDGVYLYGSGTTGTVIAGNKIGTDITGTLSLGNQNGVRVENAPDNTIGGTVSGDTNLISGNSFAGIQLYDAGTTGTIIAGNKIGTDITGTLAVANYSGRHGPQRARQRHRRHGHRRLQPDLGQ